MANPKTRDPGSRPGEIWRAVPVSAEVVARRELPLEAGRYSGVDTPVGVL